MNYVSGNCVWFLTGGALYTTGCPVSIYVETGFAHKVADTGTFPSS
jgi:hypothetical protein